MKAYDDPRCRLDQVNGSESVCLMEANTEHEAEVDNDDTANANSHSTLLSPEPSAQNQRKGEYRCERSRMARFVSPTMRWMETMKTSRWTILKVDWMISWWSFQNEL